jgi:hypothetical protein
LSKGGHDAGRRVGRLCATQLVDPLGRQLISLFVSDRFLRSLANAALLPRTELAPAPRLVSATHRLSYTRAWVRPTL